MCAIAGRIHLDRKPLKRLRASLSVMNTLQRHRGPDDEGIWMQKKNHAGFGHRRLSIIDIEQGKQPMTDIYQNTICYNGEIYNYQELRQQLPRYPFRTSSDTEVILAAYHRWGFNCVDYFRGMFSFALWDEKKQLLFCARDRFGIKPFYYTLQKREFFFSSETKALLPFIKNIETNNEALGEYFVFQYCLGEKTLFKHIIQLPPAHVLIIRNGIIQKKRYWDVHYNRDFHHTKKYFTTHLHKLLTDSVALHLRSDVPVGCYLSGGVDSSIITVLAHKLVLNSQLRAFTGTFKQWPRYDESTFAREVAEKNHLPLVVKNITAQDFQNNIEKIIYHLDFPVAGPGAFPQYMISNEAKKYVKTVLGGQGGDEIFGGYARYLLAYLEACLKGAIDGTMNAKQYILNYTSILGNLSSLRGYLPLMQEFWRNELFDERDKRYFRLVDKSRVITSSLRPEFLDKSCSFKNFQQIFLSRSSSYFDSMTYFDTITLLPALLHVEDRMSMAAGIESRVPFLDHRLVEFVSTIPSNIKFENGELKHLLKTTFKKELPATVIKRTDKMGFPVPFAEWAKGELSEYIRDILSSRKAKQREYLLPSFSCDKLVQKEQLFGRNVWALLSLELWQQQFHDRCHVYKNLMNQRT